MNTEGLLISVQEHCFMTNTSKIFTRYISPSRKICDVLHKRAQSTLNQIYYPISSRAVITKDLHQMFHMCVCVCVCVCVCAFMLVRMHACLCFHAYMFVCACMQAYVCANVHVVCSLEQMYVIAQQQKVGKTLSKSVNQNINQQQS